MRSFFGRFSAATILAASILATACSTAPSDAEVIKAVGRSDFFTGGYGNVLQEPVVVLERGERGKDGAWPVKVRMKFTFRKTGSKEATAVENSPVFKLRKVKDASGKDQWWAELSS